MLTIGLVFLLAKACQHKIRKIGITILSLSLLKLCILQDWKHLKSIYLAPFYSPRKILEIVHFIFLSNTTLHEESKKFGSPKLDIYNSTYEFSKFANISEKE